MNRPITLPGFLPLFLMIALAEGPTFAAGPAATAGLAPADLEQRNSWRADTRMLVPKLDQAPEIDGRMTEAAWQQAAGLEVGLNARTHNLFPRQTTWRVGWDGRHLYIASRTPILKGDEPWEANAAAKAAVAEGTFDAELAIPFRALPVRSRSGEALAVLLVRHYRGALQMKTPIAAADYDDPARFARMVLTQTGPVVSFDAPAGQLYEKAAYFAGKVHTPDDTERPGLKVTARITGLGEEDVTHYESEAELTVDEAGTFQIRGTTRPSVDIYSQDGDPYRYTFAIHTADGDELFHVHFPYNPREHRPWRADTVPGHGAGDENVVLVEPGGPMPDRWRRIIQQFKDLPEGHKVRAVSKRIFDPSNRIYFDALQLASAVNEQGVKDGLEIHRNHWSTQTVKTIEYKDGVRHGLEKHYTVANRKTYARTVIPWKNGKVEGTRRVYFPDGQLMVEVDYKDGMPVGKSTTYDTQGRVIRQTDYEGGVRHGRRVDYYPREVRRIVPIVRGEIHGVVRTYYPDGQLKSETPFRHDLQHGAEKHYNPDGQLTETRYWRDGDVVTEEQFNNPGAD